MTLCVNAPSGDGQQVKTVAGYNADTCPYYLLVTRDEYQTTLWPKVTTAEALQIAVPILSLWAIAWGFRQVAEFIKSRHMANSQE